MEAFDQPWKKANPAAAVLKLTGGVYDANRNAKVRIRRADRESA